MANPFCPECGSSDVTFRSKKQCYICDDCNTEFVPEKVFKPLRIFLSYGHDEHAEFVQRLAKDLQKHKHEVWFDLERLKPGGDWEVYIEDGLKWVAEKPGMGRIVLVMTPHSVRRPDGFCLNELARALDHHVFIIPIMLVWCTPPLSISRIQWLDMQLCAKASQIEGPYESTKNRLLEALETYNIAFEGQGALLKNHLDPLSFEADVVHYQKWFVGREWVFNDIDKWLHKPDTQRLYWVTGLPGIGKTAIATHLIQKMENLVAFHLCRRGNSEKSSPRRAVMSLAYQLSTQLPEYAEKLSSMNLSQLLSNPNVNAGALFDALIVQPLATDILRPPTPRVILIDGLDEATSDGQNSLAGFIAREFTKLPDWLRIIITSRPDPEVMVPLQEWDSWTLEAEDPRNQQDLEQYVREMLKAKFPHGVPDHVIATIIRNSEGIFLYAEWICREINSERLSVDAPQDFPKGLGGIYSGYFKDKLTKENSYKNDITRYGETIRPILELILAAREPLKMEQIAEWMGLQRYQTEAFFKDMGSLFFLDSGGCIRPFHSSVLDWLGDCTKAGDFFVDAEAGNKNLTAFLWKECQAGTTDQFSHYALRFLPSHLIKEQRWDDVVDLLCNLEFIQAKAAAKLTYELVEDFNNTLVWIPENAGNIERERQRFARMQGYTQNLIAYAKGKIKALDITQSVTPWTKPELEGEVQRIIAKPDRADILRDFANFLGNEASNLQTFAPVIPNFAYQQAWNHSSGGAVGRAANMFHPLDQTLLLLRPSACRPDYHPLPQALKMLRGHTSFVTSVCITPDGKRAVSGSWDRTCILWDMQSGEAIHTLRGHTGSVSSVSITPDGTKAISGSSDGYCILWDLKRGESIGLLQGHTETVNSVSLTPDGKWAISGSWDKTCILWNLQSGEAIHTLRGHSGSVTSVCITPEGKKAISGSGDKTCILWDLESGEALQTLKGHTNGVTSVCITPDRKRAISGSVDFSCIVWDLVNAKAIHSLKGHSDVVSSVCITPDGKKAISGSKDKTCILWDTDSGESINALKGHTDWVNAVSITPDGKRGISGSWDNTCILWDLEGGEAIPALKGHNGAVNSICLTPDGKKALSGSKDTTCILSDLESGEIVQTFKGHKGSVSAVSISADGKTALSGSVDETCILWDMESGEAIRTHKSHNGAVSSVCITPDGKKALSGSKTGACTLWDMESGETIHSLDGHTGTVSSICISSDGKHALSGSADGSCILWNMESGKPIHSLAGHHYPINSVSISPDGKRAISGSVDRTCILWDLESGKAIHTLIGHSRTVESVCIAPDGKRAISGSWDKTCIIWDMETGDKIAQYPLYSIPQSMAASTGLLVLGLESGEVMALKAAGSLLCPSRDGSSSPERKRKTTNNPEILTD